MGTGLQKGAPQAEATDFGALRATILEHLNVIRQIGLDRTQGPILSEVREITDKLLANRFYLAVLGQFKQGKTTLINSLLGADVLPAAVVPLTSVITILTYGEAPEANVVLLSGGTKAIAADEIAEYVTERRNPRNAKGVKQVEVRYPSPYLDQGILLVDTPGVGSTYRHNTAITHSFLARVDAAIFLLSVEPPLTQAEAEFLRQAKQHVHHFFFVLNKIDLMNEAEMRESLAFTAEQIRQETSIREVELFPLSARHALEAKVAQDHHKLAASGLPAFESALSRFLLKDKGAILLCSVLADVLRIAGDLRFNMELEVRAAAIPVQELDRKQRMLEQELQRIEQDRSDMNVLLGNEISRLVGIVDADLREAVEHALPLVRQRLEEFLSAHPKASRSELARLLDEFMAEQVERIFEAWRSAEDSKLSEAFRAASLRFTDKTNAMIRGIRALTSRLFQINVQTFDAAEPLQVESQPYYKTDPLFYFTVERVPFVLPKLVFRDYLRSKMRDRIRQELERNAGRLRYHYLERIEKSTNEFRTALNLKIDATSNGIRQALERATEVRRESLAQHHQYAERRIGHDQQLARIIRECGTLLRQLQSWVSPI